MHWKAAQHQAALSERALSPSLNGLLALAAAGLYLLLHPYLGITHDARLYSLQALNHLRPDLYGNDIFLHHGSQDEYTFFTPLYAAVVSWLGIEPAAAFLTFLSQAAFLLSAFLLARHLHATRQALFALCLLLLLPDHYGPARIFSFLEEFITPRQLAEALVLFGITAWLRRSRKLAVVFVACAMLTHPIMGLAGAALFASDASLPHWRKVLPAILAIPLLAILAGKAGLIPAHFRIDEEWLAIVLGRAEYLSLLHWSSDDWGRAVTVLATLAIAAKSLRGEMHRLAIAMLLSTGTLMLFAFVGADLLRISLIMQAQPWRALWLATVIAILLIPALAIECWREKGLRRCGLLLLAAAWLVPAENIALLIAPLAIVAVAASSSKLEERHLHLLLWGSWLVLGLVSFTAVAVAALALHAGIYNVSVSPPLDFLRVASSTGVLMLAGLLSLWLLAKSINTQARVALNVVLASLVVATAVPTVRTWLAVQYGDSLKAAFSDWRARIPPGSDVMWAADPTTGADGAVITWLLLERPSYVSRIQATTSLFSRQAALEIRRRTESVIKLLPDLQSLYPRNATIELPKPLLLSRVCQSTSVRYIVARASFVDATPVPAPPRVRPPFNNLKLYICP